MGIYRNGSVLIMIKIGFDIHGCIDTYPDIFSSLGKLFVDSGMEVHVITGASWNDRTAKELSDNGMVKGENYTHFFSIVDYHKSIGNEIEIDDKGNPWLPNDIWDKTKAVYCSKQEIKLMFDDSDIYGKYFNLDNTMYCQIIKKDEE
jgi:hypothetical protein